ncbi:hypothetical protein [Edaphobacter dinghuensis]|uniref:Uncharacterized protein n=1 Tax=Edaphobacter dinghuensis TaxID=1560005 RepID=A0A917HIQ5_9BACT|nr:hypothetical protein [Edaphobacter dinghuensis]GGG80444.1 hypothetical protein GCM10011585_24820 [Edaphobacter dinghuensis]
MATIRVPGPPPEAFRKNRPISDLIKSQIKHFQHLEHKLKITLPTKFLPHDLTTEAVASQYISEMTAALRDRASAAQPTPAPIRVVSSPRPDTAPETRSAIPVPAKSTRQSNRVAIAASASKKSDTKKHAKKKS